MDGKEKMITELDEFKAAELCGSRPVQDSLYFSNGHVRTMDIPAYGRDLNASAELRTRITTPAEKVKFLNTLRGIVEKRLERPVSDFDLLDAEASDQLEAFLITKGVKR